MGYRQLSLYILAMYGSIVSLNYDGADISFLKYLIHGGQGCISKLIF